MDKFFCQKSKVPFTFYRVDLLFIFPISFPVFLLLKTWLHINKEDYGHNLSCKSLVSQWENRASRFGKRRKSSHCAIQIIGSLCEKRATHFRKLRKYSHCAMHWWCICYDLNICFRTAWRMWSETFSLHEQIRGNFISDWITIQQFEWKNPVDSNFLFTWMDLDYHQRCFWGY